MASAEAITVLLRVRPCTQADAPTCLTAADDGVRVGDENFQFSHVFDQAASQEDVFEHAGRCVVETTLRGFNSTVMAYGQTGSGKTHTVSTNPGTEKRESNPLECFGIVRIGSRLRCASS